MLERHRKIGVPVLGVVLALGLTACVGGGDDTPDTSPASRVSPSQAPPTPPLTKVWSIKATPFSGTVEVGGTAVVYLRKGRDLQIAALDPATGTVLWSDRASPSIMLRGIPIWVSPIGDAVAYFRPAVDLHARLVLRDAKTGKKLATSASRLFDSPPWACGAGGQAACVVVRGSDGTPRVQQLSRQRPQLTTVPGLPAETFPVTDEGVMLRLPDSGNIERVGWMTGGKLAWKRPALAVFGPGATLSAGWDFSYHRAEGIVTGSAGVRAWTRSTRDLTKSATIAFRADDGTQLWREPRTAADCFGGSSLSPPGTDSNAVPLRCRYTGSLRRKGDSWVPGKGFGVRLERFDLATGRTLWSTPVGRAPAFAFGVDDAKARLRAPSEMVIDTGRAKIIVNLESGRATPAPAETQAWCRPESVMKYLKPVYYDGVDADYEIRSTGLAFPCALDGKAVPSLSLTQVPGVVAPAFGAISVVAQPKAIIGYRAG